MSKTANQDAPSDSALLLGGARAKSNGRRRFVRSTGFQPLYLATTALGCAQPVIAFLVKMGFLEGEMCDGQVISVRIPDGTTLGSVADRFFENPGRCLTLADFDRFKLISLRLLQKPQPRIPSSIIDDAFAYLERNGLRPTQNQLRQLIGGPGHLVRAIFHQEMAARGLLGTRLTSRNFAFKSGSDEEDVVLSRVHPDIRVFPGTCLDPQAVGLGKRPHPSLFARLNKIKNKDLLETMTILTYCCEQQGLRPNHIREALAAMKELCAFSRGRDLRNPVELRHTLYDALGPDWEHTPDIGFSRVNIPHKYMWVIAKFDGILAELARSDQSFKYERFRPTLPFGHVELWRRVREAKTRIKNVYGGNRQARIQKILENPVEFQAVGQIRVTEHEKLLAAVDREIDRILAGGELLEKPVKLAIAYETNLVTEHFKPCRQTIHLELWPWEMLLSEIRTAARDDPRSASHWQVRPNTPREGRKAFAIRLIGVTPEQPGGPVQLPVIAEVALGNLLDRSVKQCAKAMAAVEEARRRLEFDLRTWKVTEGMPNFGRPEARIARGARTFLDFIILPLRELTLGLVIADTAGRIMLDSSGRWHEASQLQLGRDKILQGYDEKLGVTVWSFKAFPKGDDVQKEYHFSHDTMSRVLRLCELLNDSWHGGRGIPITLGNIDHQRKGLPPARHVFHSRNGILMHDQLGVLFRLLYLGWDVVKAHDHRHLFASLTRRGGMPRAQRLRIMNHRQAETNAKYGCDTPRQNASDDARHAAFMLERHAKLIQALDPANTADALRIERELRLQTRILEFHADEEDLDAIDETREKIRSLSAQLAEAKAQGE